MKLKPWFMDFDPKIGHSSVSMSILPKKKKKTVSTSTFSMKKKCKHELVTYNFFNVI